ncbi:hypothetical protein [Streptomyces globisporus]|uniref:hypothetical protein n=1 Tax=Streptomyces globisporus TaxID=1908 RepID=UPI0006907138|nr:hypothetical protein [Streptomyces globisporus]
MAGQREVPLATAQFFEYVEEIMSWTTEGDTVRPPATLLRPVAAADATRAVADIAVGTPLHGTPSTASAT